jgi:hypothetical protein
VAIGSTSLFSATSGGGNTAVGYASVSGVQSGVNNTGIGNRALANGTGSTNTALGYNSGWQMGSGSKNVIIGSNSGSTIANLSNNIIISDGDGNIRAQYLSASSGWTLGTVVSGTWSGTTIGTSKGGTGLTSIGTASQVLKVNSGATGLEWGTVAGAVYQASEPSGVPEGTIWVDSDASSAIINSNDFVLKSEIEAYTPHIFMMMGA